MILFLFFAENLSAQKVMLQKAEENYEAFAYVDASEIYEAVVNSGFYNEDILKKLANSYYFRAEYRKAFPHYARLFRIAENLPPEYYVRYAHSLKSVKRYTEADAIMQEFHAKVTTDSRGKLAVEEPDYLGKSRQNISKFQIGITAINSQSSDYGSAFYLNKVVFTSARDTGGIKNRVHKWTNTAFTKMYVAEMHSRTKELSNVIEFAPELSTKYHESTPTFTPDGKRMFFSRNNFFNNEKKANNEGVTLVSIYEAVYRNGT
jgi:tetratricopeptide (TPR) repeat protein